MSQYCIEVQWGFKIQSWLENCQHCQNTLDPEKYLKFNSIKDAENFINEHNGNGLWHDTAKIIEL